MQQFESFVAVQAIRPGLTSLRKHQSSTSTDLTMSEPRRSLAELPVNRAPSKRLRLTDKPDISDWLLQSASDRQPEYQIPQVWQPFINRPHEVLPSDQRISSIRMLDDHFSTLLRYTSPVLIGELGGMAHNQIMMPRNAVDGRKLTWTKFSEEIKGKIVNEPQTTDDCWMIKGIEGDTSGYPSKKITKSGERNKQRVHRIMYFWNYPEELNQQQGKVVAHRCGRGRFDFEAGIERACINPYHLVHTDQRTNLDHDGCRRSCAAWCPHRPRCVFTDDEGRYLPCRNSVPMVHPCVCEDGGCFPEEK